MEIKLKGIPSRGYRFTDAMCLTNILYVLALEAKDGNVSRKAVNETLAKNNGLRAALALCGLSMSALVKIIHLARTCDDADLRDTLRYRDWDIEGTEDTEKVWDVIRVEQLVLQNATFRKGIVDLFFDGISLSILQKNFEPREIKKLSAMRMSVKPHALIETLVDYGLYYEHAQSVRMALEELSRQLEN